MACPCACHEETQRETPKQNSRPSQSRKMVHLNSETDNATCRWASLSRGNSSKSRAPAARARKTVVDDNSNKIRVRETPRHQQTPRRLCELPSSSSSETCDTNHTPISVW